MAFPLTLDDFSLWIAVSAIILLSTAELLSPYYGRSGIVIDKRKVRVVAIYLGVLFLITVVFRVFAIILLR